MDIKKEFAHLNLTEVEFLNKGWSSDEKYILTGKDDGKYLLRISDIDSRKSKNTEFELIGQCYEAGLPVQKPIEQGICNEKQFYYLLLSWIDGEEAGEMLPKLPEETQYALGLKAGEYLKKIHQLEVPQPDEDWESRYNRKIDRKIKMYEQCEYKYNKGDLFIKYINDHRHLLDNRTQSLHHGDYHCSNMIIDAGHNLHIIDFNRHDVGEPWEEFNRIVWCAQMSPAFASSRIDGYFNGGVPNDFWQLLLLYICTNTLSSLPWGVPFGQQQIDIFMEQADEILEWYDDLETNVPTWYKYN